MILNKRIISKADLAINGASHAFEQLIHVGPPSMGDNALFMTSVQQIFGNQWLTNNGPLVQELE